MKSIGFNESKAVGEINLASTNDTLSELTPVGRIRWIYDHFGKKGLVSTTSGGKTSRILPALIEEALGFSIPTIFIDTGHYPDKTYHFIDAMEKQGIDIRYYQSRMSRKRMEALYGEMWNKEGVSFENFLTITKHEPLNRAFHELEARVWIRGIMNFQTKERTKTQIFEYKKGLYRLHPVIDWTQKTAVNFLKDNNLPINNKHFDITKGPCGKMECKIGERGGFANGGGI
jgi:phosphoadenosine phosphosulfate reductase